MQIITMVFDGRNVAWVQVPDTEWTAAVRVIGGWATASQKRECVAVGKMLQAGYVCQAATNAAWDVELRIGAGYRPFDIKTLYPAYDDRGLGGDEQANALMVKADSEVRKEQDQESCCLFDLSYLAPGVQAAVEQYLLKTHPTVMTLRYDAANSALFVNGKSKM
jgi:hypothetical protein